MFHLFHRHRFKFFSAAAVFGMLLWFWTRPTPVTAGVNLRQALEAMGKSEFSKAEQHFRAELQLVPQQPVASEKLATLLVKSGRRWEASKYIATVLSQVNVRYDILAPLTGDPYESIDQARLEEWHRRDPADPSPLIGLAKIAFENGQSGEARDLIQKVLAVNPHELEAHVVAGEIIQATAASELFGWNQSLPEKADHHPGIWFIRAHWCEKSGELQMAARCFLEGLRLDPHNPVANSQLGELLGADDRGKPFLDRAEQLQQLNSSLAAIRGPDSVAGVWVMVEILQSLGRAREAAHWIRIAMSTNSLLMRRMTTDDEFATSTRRILAEGETVKDLNPATAFDLRDFPEWQPTKL